MKNVLIGIVLTTFALTSCNKQEEDLTLQKKTENVYNQKCGKESNMIAKLTIPFDMDKEVGQTMIDMTAKGIETGENYMKITKDDNVQAYIIQLMKYTDSYPAHKPTTNKTIYEGEDAKNMAFTYYMSWLNLECTPVEWFVWDGVYYVEDCC